MIDAPLSDFMATKTDENGNVVYKLFKHRLNYLPKESDTIYRVQNGDRLDTIIEATYGKNYMSIWWIIADINGINNVYEFEEYEGEYIRLPSLSSIQSLLQELDLMRLLKERAGS